MEMMVADAKSKGARVLAGGHRIGNRGYFFPLTVLADVPDDARAMYEEPFGPLALVNPVKTIDRGHREKPTRYPMASPPTRSQGSARNADTSPKASKSATSSINHFVASPC